MLWSRGLFLFSPPLGVCARARAAALLLASLGRGRRGEGGDTVVASPDGGEGTKAVGPVSRGFVSPSRRPSSSALGAGEPFLSRTLCHTPQPSWDLLAWPGSDSSCPLLTLSDKCGVV